MQIPESLVQRIEELLHGRSLKELQQAWARLSIAYREGEPLVPNEVEALAYLCGRAPATFAAMTRVLELTFEHTAFEPPTHLDVGSGPGAAVWAVRHRFGSQVQSVAVDRNPHWRRWAQALAPGLDIRLMDCTSAGLPRAQLVTAGYLLNELDPVQMSSTLAALWAATEGALVLVEPGTPAGFARILQARDFFQGVGAHVMAPCPGWTQCPLAKTEQWCHFGVRFNRPRFQRLSKEGSLSWEDETFSFLSVSRTSFPLPEGRVMHHPQKRGGHVWLELCTEGNIERRVLSRRLGDLYRAARRAHWGDQWPPLEMPNSEENEEA